MSRGGLGQAIFDWGCCRIAADDRRNRDDGARTRRLKSGSASGLVVNLTFDILTKAGAPSPSPPRHRYYRGGVGIAEE